MPKFSIDGVQIYYEVHGQGFPLLWSHEFAGDYTSWEPQVNFFSRLYQVITYSARGYLPSDVPHAPTEYSQEQSVEDVRRLLEHLSIQQAYIGGLSMGGNVALNFGLTYPAMVRAIMVASAGSGSDDPELFRQEGDRLAVRLLREGMAPVANDYARGPARVQFRRKDPLGWHKFQQGLAAHVALGSALTYRGVQMKRPPIYDLADRMKRLQVPTLVLIGDEDDACVNPAIFMKRVIPRCGLAVFPRSGHTINLEEPARFNQTVLDFLIEVENGGWGSGSS